MTTTTIDLVKNSWALVAKIDMETVGGLFYNKLFEIAPEVKPMFTRSAMPEQSKKLLGMLSYGAPVDGVPAGDRGDDAINVTVAGHAPSIQQGA